MKKVAQNELVKIPLNQISPDPNQPRKTFNPQELAELVESITQKGVIQPIIVRTNPDGNGYLIVAGERRYRASLEAQKLNKSISTIPAIIKELSDEETLEIQLIENLQRADVHPLQEATGFKALNMNSSIEDIAKKVGKSPSFVALRIKLADLIKPFQELLYADKITLTTAQKLAKLATDTQTQIHEELNIPKDWSKKKDWEINEYSLDNLMEQEEKDLSKATFKTNDATLYPEAGACTNCPHNSACNQLLFPELNKKRICNNSTCFEIKTKRSYEMQLAAAATDPDVYFIAFGGYFDSSEKARIHTAEENGLTVLTSEAFSVFQKPETFPTWKEYLKDNDHWSDDEDYTEEQRKEYEADCKADFEKEKAAHADDIKAYNETLKKKLYKKAFVVVGNHLFKAGMFIEIVLKPKGLKSSLISDDAPAELKAEAIKGDIEKIHAREQRNKELDREKIYLQSMETLKPMLSTPSKDGLKNQEWVALAILIADVCYEARDFAHKLSNIEHSDYNRDELFKALSGLENPSDTVAQMIRVALFNKLVNKNNADPGRFGNAAAMMEIANLYIPEKVAEISVEQGEKTSKRLVNVEKRVKALEKQIEEPQD